jgi:hypothetical protein
MAAVFSVVILTAPPPTQASEAGGPYVKIDGREALLRSVELFLNRENVKQIQLVVVSDMLEEAKRKYGPHLGFAGVKMLAGGPKWLEQAKAAADRRLRAVQARAGPREAAKLGDGDEGLQAVNVHRSVFLMLMANTMHSTEGCPGVILR